MEIINLNEYEESVQLLDKEREACEIEQNGVGEDLSRVPYFSY